MASMAPMKSVATVRARSTPSSAPIKAPATTRQTSRAESTKNGEENEPATTDQVADFLLRRFGFTGGSRLQSFLNHAPAIHSAAQPGVQGVDQGGNRGQQKDRCHRQLDDVTDIA